MKIIAHGFSLQRYAENSSGPERYQIGRLNLALLVSVVAQGNQRVHLRGALRGNETGEKGDQGENCSDSSERERIGRRDREEHRTQVSRQHQRAKNARTQTQRNEGHSLANRQSENVGTLSA